ncbi:hypothetical protein ACFPVY_14095 [Flavobacterium qiangtangense]|uniref:Uncharacterized protein n=1 Tax=Flavobacterium qiangtangense TaxID=1442595 RepID=A0ABW1PRB8_9FLAO
MDNSIALIAEEILLWCPEASGFFTTKDWNGKQEYEFLKKKRPIAPKKEYSS